MRAKNRTTRFFIPLWDRTMRILQRSCWYQFVTPAPLAAGFREFQIQIGIGIVKLLAPVSTALNQIGRLSFLSMIFSKSRFPLFEIMLQHPLPSEVR
jgi:hypothetical protein